MAKGISRTKDRSRWGLYKNIFALIHTRSNKKPLNDYKTNSILIMVRHKQNEMVETQSKRLKVKSSVRKIIRLIDVQGCAMWEPKVLNDLAWKIYSC